MNMVYKYVMLQDSCWWLMEHLFESEKCSASDWIRPATFDIPYGRSNTLRHCDTQGLRANNGNIRFFPGCL